MTYRIVRHYRNAAPEVIREGLTLREAQQYCNTTNSQEQVEDDFCRSEWVDNYERENDDD